MRNWRLQQEKTDIECPSCRGCWRGCIASFSMIALSLCAAPSTRSVHRRSTWVGQKSPDATSLKWYDSRRYAGCRGTLFVTSLRSPEWVRHGTASFANTMHLPEVQGEVGPLIYGMPRFACDAAISVVSAKMTPIRELIGCSPKCARQVRTQVSGIGRRDKHSIQNGQDALHTSVYFRSITRGVTLRACTLILYPGAGLKTKPCIACMFVTT